MPEASGKDNYGIGANFYLHGFDQPVYSEIDIFEFVGTDTKVNPYKRNPNRYTNNAHYNASNDPVNDNYGNINFYQPFNNTYHTFGLAWFPDGFEYYIDGSIQRASTFEPTSYYPMNIVVDQNVFSFGEVIGTDPNPPSNQTIMPYNFKVDYVKVYQYQNPTSTSGTVTYCDLNNYVPTLFNHLILSGGTCNATLSNNKQVYFRATSDITFAAGFFADIGSSFYAETIPLPTFNQ